LKRVGLRYNAKAIGSGAQTERRGEAGPVRVLLGGGHVPATLLASLLQREFKDGQGPKLHRPGYART
jgi:hypothetical protein